jgi:NADPH:quinone reductase-like Zn-dependent oxidoreductase
MLAARYRSLVIRHEVVVGAEASTLGIVPLSHGAKKGGSGCLSQRRRAGAEKASRHQDLCVQWNAGLRQFARLNEAVDAARLRVPICASFTLEQASQAHRRVEEGHVLGKIILRILNRDRK